MTEYIDRTGESDDVFEREVLARFEAAEPAPESNHDGGRIGCNHAGGHCSGGAR